MNELQNSLLESIGILAKSSADENKGTLTVACKILAVIDEGLGLYNVEYLGNNFNAYTNNTAIQYAINDEVYVIIPDGDFDKQKIIIGTTAPSASISTKPAAADKYIDISTNLFSSVNDNKNIELCTYNTEEFKIPLGLNSFNLIFSNYLKDYNTFAFSAKIKTNIEVKQQVNGNYGLVLSLPFVVIDTAGEEIQTWKEYPIDVNTISGNPYRLSEWSLQKRYFTIDSQDIYDNSRVPHITAFVEDFSQNKQIIASDIFIKDIQLIIADMDNQVGEEGYALSLSASEGEYFLKDSYSAEKVLTPNLKINGKTTSIENHECYWFVEDASVKTDSSAYLEKGGIGWRCLNNKTNVSFNEDGMEVFQYVTNAYTFIINSKNIKTSLRYKCVISYNNILINDIITIKNLNSDITIDLFSATGSNAFVKAVGYVDLICSVDYPGVSNALYSDITIGYEWSRFDKYGNYIDDSFYELINLNQSVDGVYKTEIKYPTNLVEDVNTIYCSAFSLENVNGEIKKTILGTAHLTVFTSEDFSYRTTIQNGDVLYKYDADGDSPLVADYDGPESSVVKAINPLDFKIYKADGTELTEDEYKYVDTTWIVPKNSLIKIELNSFDREDDNYFYYNKKGRFALPYTILNSYSAIKNDNVIRLITTFDKVQMDTSTILTMIKDGESGTNGSKYAGFITHNDYGYGEKDSKGIPQKLKFTFVKETNSWMKHNTLTNKLESFGAPALGAKVYKDGNQISSREYSITWSLFDSGSTDPCFGMNSNTLTIAKNWTDSSIVYCNIVEAKIRVGNTGDSNAEEYLYAYYPIEISYLEELSDATEIVPSIENGFSSVVYAADGTNPKYDNVNDFVCKDNLYNLDANDYYDYSWSASENLKVESTVAEKCNVKPITKFDNGESKNYVKVALQMSASKRQQLTAKVKEYQNEVTKYQNLINFYTKNKGYMDNFLSHFQYNHWIELLDGARSALAQRTSSLKIIEQAFVNLETWNSFCKANPIISQYVDYTKIYSDTREDVQEAKDILFDLGSHSDLGDVKSLQGSLINSVANAELKQALGASIYAKYQLLLNDFNESIKQYQLYYALLTQQVDGAYVFEDNVDKLKDIIDLFKDLPSYLDSLTSGHDGNAPDGKYINIKENLILLYDYFLNQQLNYTSYSDIKQNILGAAYSLIDEFGDAQPAAADKGCIMSDYEIAYYDNNIKNATDQKNIFDKKYTDANNLFLTGDAKIIHVKPIVMTFNRYEMSNINGWDGNKLYVDKNNQTYLLAPQVGAGRKDDGLFTGMIMGIRSVNKSANTETGLFGYNKGIQSMLLNAKDGSATFGMAGKGQVIISPGENKAIIKSGNYSTSTETGLQIDLTTPEIKFGSGNFMVAANGHITAKGGGSIAGWEINDTTLKSSNKNLTFDSKNAIIYSDEHNGLTQTNQGFYLGADGISIGNAIRVNSSVDSPSVEVGRITSSRKWLISGNSANSYISYNKTSLSANGTGVYIGTDGFRLGDRFKVSNEGTLEIGSLLGNHWTISSNGSNSYIGYNKNSLTSEGTGVYIGTDGFRLGDKFKVTNTGVLEVGNLKGNHWTIDGNSSTSYFLYGTKAGANSVYVGTDAIILGNNRFKVDNAGNMSGGVGNDVWSISSTGAATFNSFSANNHGSIANWTILPGRLQGGNLGLWSTGAIQGPTWGVTAEGVATFNNVICTNQDGTSGSSFNWKSGGQTVFSVSSGGQLMASLANITGAVTATTGKIGETTISGGALISANGNFKVDRDGNLIANNATFSGSVTASNLTIRNAGGGYLGFGNNDHLTVSGLNVGTAGIVVNGGINCNNIGNSDGVYIQAAGIWKWGSTGDLKFGHSGEIEKSLGEVIDGKIEYALQDYVRKNTSVTGDITAPAMGGACQFSLKV